MAYQGFVAALSPLTAATFKIQAGIATATAGTSTVVSLADVKAGDTVIVTSGTASFSVTQAIASAGAITIIHGTASGTEKINYVVMRMAEK